MLVLTSHILFQRVPGQCDSSDWVNTLQLGSWAVSRYRCPAPECFQLQGECWVFLAAAYQIALSWFIMGQFVHLVKLNPLHPLSTSGRKKKTNKKKKSPFLPFSGRPLITPSKLKFHLTPRKLFRIPWKKLFFDAFLFNLVPLIKLAELL